MTREELIESAKRHIGTHEPDYERGQEPCNLVKWRNSKDCISDLIDCMKELLSEAALAAQQPETLAWGVVGLDGQIRPALCGRTKLDGYMLEMGERVVRVAIRVVEDDYGGNTPQA